ncbi:MAG: lytic transglycosylase domain-containing protein [Clostridiaceae bacterium]|nr:lytic transglycosylase domain-containing protein [Clostridiaceae bacterium]
MLKNMVQQIFQEKISQIQRTIPVNFNHPITKTTYSFQEVLEEKTLELSSSKSPDDFDTIINSAAKKYNLSPALIKSVMKAESNFNPNALSKAGAQGLMQLMPSTANQLGVKNVWDPQQNIEGGSKYLRNLLNQYNGDLTLSLAAYNAGPGNVNKYGGVPPFAETQNYVKTVSKYLSTYKG